MGLFSSSHSSHHSSSSHYKRRSRDGYLAQMYQKIRRAIRHFIRWAKQNPIKFFMMVVMPLLTGGALHSVLGRFGIHLPDEMFGGKRGGRGGGGLQGLAGLAGGAGGVEGLLSVAKMFM